MAIPELAELKRRMAEKQLTQSELAAACGLSQPHLSKVLAGKVALTGRTAQTLAAWLERQDHFAQDATLLSIDRKLRNADAGRRMQIMQLLKSLDGLIGP